MREKHFLSVPFWLIRFAFILLIAACAWLIYECYTESKTNERYTRNGQISPPDAGHDLADENEPAAPSVKFSISQKAIFDFTGDTVLILGKCEDYPYLEEDFWQVLYKNEFDRFVKADLPEKALIPLVRDSTQIK